MCVYVGELASQWMVGSRDNEYVGGVIRENLRTRLAEMQRGGGGHGRGKPAQGSQEEVAARLPYVAEGEEELFAPPEESEASHDC